MIGTLEYCKFLLKLDRQMGSNDKNKYIELNLLLKPLNKLKIQNINIARPYYSTHPAIPQTTYISAEKSSLTETN